MMQKKTFFAEEVGEGDVGDYSITFSITAGRVNNVYVGDVLTKFPNQIGDSIGGFSVEKSLVGPEELLQESGNYKISKGETAEFTVAVTLTAASTTSRVSHSVGLSGVQWSNRDNNNYDLYVIDHNTYKTGELSLKGISVEPEVFVEYVSYSSVIVDDAGTIRDFTLVFDVTAVGDDVEIDRTVFDGVAGLEISVVGPADASSSATLSSNASRVDNIFTVLEGMTRRFTLVVAVSDAEATGIYKVVLNSVAGSPVLGVETGGAVVVAP
jgi:hypothetical protein